MRLTKPIPVLPLTGPKLRNVRVTIVGLGKSGRAAMEACLSHGAQVVAVDEKPLGQILDCDAMQQRGVRLVCGPFSDSLWQQADVVVVSPGVPLALPVFESARAAGVPVVGEIELATQLMTQSHGPVVGITGTNGKSTTTALTGALFQKQFERVFVGGNLGRPLTDAVSEAFDAKVVELSSFQLEGIVKARFSAAAWLNLTADHLDRYADLQAYAAAKARVFLNQSSDDVLVLNADDANVVTWGAKATSRVFGFSSSLRPVAYAKKFEGMAMALPREAGFVLDVGSRLTFELQNRALRGKHNLENAMAASWLAWLSGVSAENIQAGLDAFPGLSHRLESVRLLDGVEWINDSKATNVDSTVMALKALPGPLWLIAGGKGKGAPYSPMVEASVGKVKGVLTIGADADNIAKAYHDVLPVSACQTLERAVKLAKTLAKSGDYVLLSPACASYDQFNHFEDRGDQFKALVRAL